MNFNRNLAIGLIVLFLGGLIYKCSRDYKIDTDIVSPVLSSSETKKIIVQPSQHRIDIVTRTGTESVALPGNRPTSITEDIHGNLTVQTRTWGTEFSPFGGIGISDKVRGIVGVGIFYFHRWDINIGLSSQLQTPLLVRGLLAGSYCVYSNTYLLLGLETDKRVITGLVWRF